MYFSESTFWKYSLTPTPLELMKARDKEINGKIPRSNATEQEEQIQPQNHAGKLNTKVKDCVESDQQIGDNSNYPQNDSKKKKKKAATAKAYSKDRQAVRGEDCDLDPYTVLERPPHSSPGNTAAVPSDKPPFHVNQNLKEDSDNGKQDEQNFPSNSKTSAKSKSSPDKAGHSKKDKCKKDENKQKNGKKGPTFVYPVHATPFPRPSWLTKEEQKRYLELCDEFMCGVQQPKSPAVNKHIQLFKELQQRVLPEQEEYMNYLRGIAYMYPENYDSIREDLKSYIRDILEDRKQRTVNYPRFYVQDDTVGLVVPPSDVPFFHVKSLLNLGEVPMFNIRKHQKGRQQFLFSTATQNNMRTKIPVDYPAWANKKVCSEDEICEQLGGAHSVDVVISSSALCCLVDNHPPYQRHWELPFEVREMEVLHEKGTVLKKKVVYIDKPFVPRQMTQRQRNEWGHKFMLKHTFQNENFTLRFRPQADQYGNTVEINPPKVNKTAKKTHGSEEIYDYDNLETFGTGPVKKLKIFEEIKTHKVNKTAKKKHESEEIYDLEDLETFGTGPVKKLKIFEDGSPPKRLKLDSTMRTSASHFSAKKSKTPNLGSNLDQDIHTQSKTDADLFSLDTFSITETSAPNIVGKMCGSLSENKLRSNDESPCERIDPNEKSKGPNQKQSAQLNISGGSRTGQSDCVKLVTNQKLELAAGTRDAVNERTDTGSKDNVITNESIVIDNSSSVSSFVGTTVSGNQCSTVRQSGDVVTTLTDVERLSSSSDADHVTDDNNINNSNAADNVQGNNARTKKEVKLDTNLGCVGVSQSSDIDTESDTLQIDSDMDHSMDIDIHSDMAGTQVDGTMDTWTLPQYDGPKDAKTRRSLGSVRRGKKLAADNKSADSSLPTRAQKLSEVKGGSRLTAVEKEPLSNRRSSRSCAASVDYGDGTDTSQECEEVPGKMIQESPKKPPNTGRVTRASKDTVVKEDIAQLTGGEGPTRKKRGRPKRDKNKVSTQEALANENLTQMDSAADTSKSPITRLFSQKIASPENLFSKFSLGGSGVSAAITTRNFYSSSEVESDYEVGKPLPSAAAKGRRKKKAEEQEETGYVLDNKEVRPKRTTQNPTHKEIKPCSQTNSTSIKNEDEMDKELILESAKQGKSTDVRGESQTAAAAGRTVTRRPRRAAAAVAHQSSNGSSCGENTADVGTVQSGANSQQSPGEEAVRMEADFTDKVDTSHRSSASDEDGDLKIDEKEVDLNDLENDLDVSSESDSEVESPTASSRRRHKLQFSDEEDSGEEQRKAAEQTHKKWLDSVRKPSECHTKHAGERVTRANAHKAAGQAGSPKKPAVKVKASVKSATDYDSLPTSRPPRKHVCTRTRSQPSAAARPAEPSGEIAETVQLADTIPIRSSALFQPDHRTVPQPAQYTLPQPGHRTLPQPGPHTLPQLGHHTLPQPDNRTLPQPAHHSLPQPAHRTLPSAKRSQPVHHTLPPATSTIPPVIIADTPSSPAVNPSDHMPVPVPTSVNQVADNRASVMASAPKVIPLERDLHSKAQGFLAGRKKQTGGATFDEVFGNIASSAFNPYSGKISMNIGGMPGITPIVPKQSYGLSDAGRDILAPPRRTSTYRRDGTPQVSSTAAAKAVSYKPKQDLKAKQARRQALSGGAEGGGIGILDQLLPKESPAAGEMNANADSVGISCDNTESRHGSPSRNQPPGSLFDNISASRNQSPADGPQPGNLWTGSHIQGQALPGDVLQQGQGHMETPQTQVEFPHGPAFLQGHREFHQGHSGHRYPAPSHIRDRAEWEMYEKPEEFTAPKKHNVTYNLWQLGNHKVLIRCGLHAAKLTKFNKAKNTLDGKVDYVHFQPKLEFQNKHGYEQETLSEISRGWISLAIRNNCLLHRSRILAHNSEVAETEFMTLDQLSQPRATFSEKASLASLAAIFQKLTSLQRGHYLLGHSPGNTSAHIKKTSSNQGAAYDLHTAYTDLELDRQAVPWVPLDTTKLTPLLRHFNRVPCTFEPKDSQTAKVYQLKAQSFDYRFIESAREGGKRKRRKKKKKKT